MATLLVKGLLTAGTLATVSGVGTAIYLNTGTTIGDKLTSKGLELISDLDDYKIHLFEHKSDSKLQGIINQQTIKFDEHFKDLKKWCESKLKEWASSDKDESVFKNAEAWCTVPKVRTLREKIQGNFYGETEWQGKYTGFAGNNVFLKVLKADLKDQSLNSTTQDGGKKLNEWCQNVMKLKVYEVTIDKSEVNIKTWCIKG